MPKFSNPFNGNNLDRDKKLSKRVLFELDENEKVFYDKGFDEVQDIIKKPSKI